jgi:predicted dehydrogenase
MTTPVAVVGTGYMGSRHARVLTRLAGAKLALVVDANGDRARTIAERHGTDASTDIADVAQKAPCAVVAVPTEAHVEVALRLIEDGIDILVEKPLASTSKDAAVIVDAAAANHRILAVGHIERFNPVCLELMDIVRDPLFITTRRTSPFDGRIRESIITDLMVHDVDMVLALAGKAAVERVAVESTATRSGTDDLAVATIAFDSGMIAQLTASRISHEKVRLIDIVQRDCSITADLLHQSVEVRRETTVAFIDEGGTRLRETTTVEIPYLDRRGEPLIGELEDFVDAVRTRRPPLVDGIAGTRAIDVCERLLASRNVGRMGHDV